MSAWFRLYLSMINYIMGVVITIAADTQKNTFLKHVKERPILITDGLFSRSRNMNYFGEMLLYSSFATVSNHWISYSIVFWAFLSVMPVRMIQKESSLVKKPGFKNYARDANFLIPKIFGLADLEIVALVMLGLTVFAFI